MSKGLKVLLLCFAVTGAAALAYSMVFLNLDMPEVHFEDYGKLKEAAYDRTGWLPNEMPQSAIDIHEIHNFATGNSLASFKLQPNTLTRFRQQIRTRIGNDAKPCEPEQELVNAATFWPDDLGGEPIAVSPTRSFTIGDGVIYFNTCKN